MMDPAMLIAVATLAAVAVLMFSLLARQREAGQTLGRVETRLDEQGKRNDALSAQLNERSRSTEEVVHKLDRDMREQQTHGQQAVFKDLADAKEKQQQTIHELQRSLIECFGQLREGLEQRHSEALKTLQASLQSGVDRVQEQVTGALKSNADDIGKRMLSLTETTDKKLLEISGHVDRRLSEGFDKANATFTNVVERLALIDKAQKEIAELSGNVVSLQQVLNDRTSRGAFGEVQLHSLVQNVLPPTGFAMQHSLSNGNRVDCMLFLPPPTGHVPIDSKFPLENYRRKMNPDLPAEERKNAERNFSKDVRIHIDDIASKYLIAGETSEGAIMFLPAEAVFAEIHANHPDLVDYAHKSRVWMASPTTLWAILTTAKAVLRDAATRQQVHIIQEHLGKLGEDFVRFQKRMDNLALHIRQANQDVEKLHISSKKIARHFGRIERLELDKGEESVLDAALEDAVLDDEENDVEPLEEPNPVSEEEHKPQLLFDSQFD
jgi:DNA recombination protein RmuC